MRCGYRKLTISLFAISLLAGCGVIEAPPCADELCQPAPDCQGSDCGSAAPIPASRVSRVISRSAVSEIKLPRDAQQYGMDLDGDGVVDNQLGRLLATLKAFLPHVDFQAALAARLSASKEKLIYAISEHEQRVQLATFVGKATTAGSVFEIEAQSDATPVVGGSIQAGELKTDAGAGLLAIPLRHGGAVLALRRARIVAKVSDAGLTEGVLAGAIPVGQVSTDLAQLIADELHRQYVMPDQDPRTFDAIHRGFDLNNDSEITVDEVSASTLTSLLLHSADIDTDGDGLADAISFALAFSATPCQTQATRTLR